MTRTESLRTLLRQVEDLPEILGDAEDIMIDDSAMTLLNTSVESIAADIRRLLQQEISGTSINLTEYLAGRIAGDTTANSQTQSLITERGYEAQAAVRLYEWVAGHMSALLSPMLCRNPYPIDWLDWMQQVIRVGLDQVDWNEVVRKLQEAHAASVSERQE